MTRDYRETAPPPRLSNRVECFWTMGPLSAGIDHRVLPDGCTDLIFSIANGHVRATAVGAMTQPLVTPLEPNEIVFGVRFHPGMSHGLLPAPVEELTDQVIDLESLWGSIASALAQRIGEASSNEERITQLAEALPAAGPGTPVQRAALWVIENRGDVSIDDLARHAGLSARQFRRLCIEQTGVGPKMLCRIIRFRSAVNSIAHPPSDWATFALDHGYYDQAHFINEFRDLSGLTPAEYASASSETELERD